MEPEGSLPNSQHPATCPCRSIKSMPPHPTPLTSSVPRQLLVSNPTISSRLRPCKIFSNIVKFLRVVSTSSNPKAGGPPFVRCSRLLIQYIRQLPSISGGRSSIRNLRTPHALVTGTSLSSNAAVNINNIAKLCLIRQIICNYLVTKMGGG
jgi:hypothetical protein